MSVVKRYGICAAALMLASLRAHAAEDGADPWTGLYGGVSASYGFGSSDSGLHFVENGAFANVPPESPSSFSPDRSGFLGGLHGGYDYRIDRFVIGSQVDLEGGSIRSSADQTGTNSGPGARPFIASQGSSIDRFATLRGQAGFLATDDLLLYGFGGLAVGRVDNDSGLNFGGANGARYNGGRSQTMPGWMAGAGAEYLIDDALGLKLEYLHYDLGTATAIGFQQGLSPFHTQSDFKVSGDLVSLALDYHFGDLSRLSGENEADEMPWDPLIAALSTLKYQLGTGYFYSSGTTRYNLHSAGGGSPEISRLSYTDLDANSGELVGRIEHSSGLFVKAILGVGSVGDGNLADEDFEPFTDPASRTSSTVKDSTLSYATVDIGYPIFDEEGIRIAPFVGYAHYNEQLNAFGCAQNGGNPGICGPGTVSSSTLGITQTDSWDALRVGLGGTWTTPWHGLSVSLEGAWLPYGGLDGTDAHSLRIRTPDEDSFAGPQQQSGIARGMQLEGSFTLPLTDSIDASAGARYWYLYSHGTTLFNTVFEGRSTQATDFSVRRIGGFAQITAHF
ncbi:MAG TPA: outer membrane beta-barrel protein [Aliidongia sp.]|nr:outer membrane beta-barrel protein [Aliidongia sp.]